MQKQVRVKYLHSPLIEENRKQNDSAYGKLESENWKF